MDDLFKYMVRDGSFESTLPLPPQPGSTAALQVGAGEV